MSLQIVAVGIFFYTRLADNSLEPLSVSERASGAVVLLPVCLASFCLLLHHQQQQPPSVVVAAAAAIQRAANCSLRKSNRGCSVQAGHHDRPGQTPDRRLL